MASVLTVSEWQANIHMEKFGRHQVVNLVEKFLLSTFVGKTQQRAGFFFVCCSRKNPQTITGKGVVECGIENSVPMVAVTNSKAVIFKDISRDKGDCEHVKEMENTVLELLKRFTEGPEVDALSSDFPAGGKPDIETHSKDARSHSVAPEAGN